MRSIRRQSPLSLIAAAVLFTLGGCEERTGQSEGPKPGQTNPKPPPASPESPKPEQTPAPVEKPPPRAVSKLAADGYPTGTDSAEGVACDLARAFIEMDFEKFKAACYPDSANKQYVDFLKETADEFAKARAVDKTASNGPKEITALWKARQLSKDGPASFAFAIRLSEVQFVDVGTILHDGTRYLNRTLVVQREDDHKWLAIPMPAAFPLLSDGLNDESKSRDLWVAPDKAAGTETAEKSTSPTIAPDGFPTGNSPEGVSCDLGRAFINGDAELFRRVCYPEPRNKPYQQFIDHMAAQIERAGKLPKGAMGGPKEILKVYKARPLTSEGKTSAGYSVMRLSQVMFVDDISSMYGEPNFHTRLLVVQRESDEKWFAIPAPEHFPLISGGLNEESESTELWTAPSGK